MRQLGNDTVLIDYSSYKFKVLSNSSLSVKVHKDNKFNLMLQERRYTPSILCKNEISTKQKEEFRYKDFQIK
jgi:hypothetical protein